METKIYYTLEECTGMIIENEYGIKENLCDNSKYNSAMDCYTCDCCEAECGNDTQAKDLNLWQEVKLKSDNTVWFISKITDSMLTLVPTKSVRHKDQGIVAYDFMVEPYCA